MDHSWYHALPFGKIPRPIRDAGYSPQEIEILDIVIYGMELQKAPLKNGRRWIYNNSKKWEALLHISRNKFKKAVATLVDRKVLITSTNMNGSTYNKTMWFTVDMDELKKQVRETRDSLRDFYVKKPSETWHSSIESDVPKKGRSIYPKRGDLKRNI